MNKNRYYIFLVFLAIILLNCCQSYNETIRVDTDLQFQENNNTGILFETEPGCSKTNFKFKDSFFKNVELQKYNYLIASNYSEYENTIKEYFEMDFLNTVTQEYFSKNHLVFFILSIDDGDILKNIRIEKTKDNKYAFLIEIWDNGKPMILRNKCTYSKIIIFQIIK